MNTIFIGTLIAKVLGLTCITAFGVLVVHTVNEMFFTKPF